MYRQITTFLLLSTILVSDGLAQKKNEKHLGKEEKVYNYIATGILGTYANPPRLPNGQVDEKRLIAELSDIGANSYNWLLWRDSNSLKALKHFLPLARKAGVRVWVTLVPPSEPPPSSPFGLDYIEWAVQLATLSKKEPNLVAWSIDDFLNNIQFFSPAYVKEFLSRAHAVNPRFAFVPCCYYKYITQAFVDDYAPLLGGILFPYRAESKGANLKDASLVEQEIKKLRHMLGPKFPIVLDVYAAGHSSLGNTTPEYVNRVIEAGLKYADGILIYTHQDPIRNADKYNIIKKKFERGFSPVKY